MNQLENRDRERKEPQVLKTVEGEALFPTLHNLGALMQLGFASGANCQSPQSSKVRQDLALNCDIISIQIFMQ